MRIFILICLIIGSGFASSDREKRNVLQFGNMISCVTGRSSSDYNGYGCWCGYGGSGAPVDATDRCCRTHDRCYDNLISSGACSAYNIYTVTYAYTSTCGSYPSVTCGRGNSCQVGLCACDKTAVYCFRSSYYNTYYDDWDNDNC